MFVEENLNRKKFVLNVNLREVINNRNNNMVSVVEFQFIFHVKLTLRESQGVHVRRPIHQFHSKIYGSRFSINRYYAISYAHHLLLLLR